MREAWDLVGSWSLVYDLAAYAVEHGGLTRLFLCSWHGTLLRRALALGKVSLNSEPFCIRVQLTGYTFHPVTNRLELLPAVWVCLQVGEQSELVLVVSEFVRVDGGRQRSGGELGELFWELRDALGRFVEVRRAV
ncbi:MAG: hypothetical protein DRH23_13865 [Deltaproteobacteria bacterium]|nr:MAG: hypothetical protein DRH23_13865 [Deltaproteobacteria bacterium]